MKDKYPKIFKKTILQKIEKTRTYIKQKMDYKKDLKAFRDHNETRDEEKENRTEKGEAFFLVEDGIISCMMTQYVCRSSF